MGPCIPWGVRFAKVYRRFKDVRDFVDGLQPMLERNLPPR
jgi:transcriptional regulator NrdR family protein